VIPATYPRGALAISSLPVQTGAIYTGRVMFHSPPKKLTRGFAVVLPGLALCLWMIGCSMSPGSSSTEVSQPKALTAAEVSAYLEDPEKLFFLDVRTTQEIEAVGSISGYVHIPIDELESRLNEIPKDKLVITA
jgi:hypothetical protein